MGKYYKHLLLEMIQYEVEEYYNKHPISQINTLQEMEDHNITDKVAHNIYSFLPKNVPLSVKIYEELMRERMGPEDFLEGTNLLFGRRRRSRRKNLLNFFKGL